MPEGISSLAKKFLSKSAAARTAPVFGVAVHTTGGGVVDQGRKRGVDPLECALEYYMDPEAYFAHHVIGWDGTIVQVADENLKALHVGFQPSERAAFLDGSWPAQLPAAVTALWRARWPGVPSPAHLFPGPSPNNVYVGIELVPLGDDRQPAPIATLPQARYTEAQHRALAALCGEIAQRWQLPPEWHAAGSGRLVGHEDLNPIERHNAAGGWDPGALRAEPWIDFAFLRAHLAEPGA